MLAARALRRFKLKFVEEAQDIALVNVIAPLSKGITMLLLGIGSLDMVVVLSADRFFRFHSSITIRLGPQELMPTVRFARNYRLKVPI